jgi:hypothetical protein
LVATIIEQLFSHLLIFFFGKIAYFEGMPQMAAGCYCALLACLCIYIYIKREREGEGERERKKLMNALEINQTLILDGWK